MLKTIEEKRIIWDEWWELIETNPVLSDELIKVFAFLKELDKNNVKWLPRKAFKAFQYVSLKDLKVVVLGQDPYHTDHQPGSSPCATGMAFQDGSSEGPIRPSLRNIEAELGDKVDFESTASQGVLWLNTALTVSVGEPGSHADMWKKFTKEIVRLINEQDNIVWVLWGAHALSFKKLIDNKTHKFVISSHPSPLSCTRKLQKVHPPFKGSKPFTQVNELLDTKIIWDVKTNKETQSKGIPEEGPKDLPENDSKTEG